MRIDSHQHFWRRDRGDYDWLTPALEPIYRDYLPGDLAPHLARCDVSATVLVQAAATVAETRFMLALARQAPFVAGVVGWVDFESDAAPDVIAELAEEPKLVGLRPMIQDIDDVDWMLRPALAPAFQAMVRQGLVFDALVKPPHLKALLELAGRYPDLKMVLDHGGKPPIASGDLSGWKSDVTALARSTAMMCKLSGLVTEAANPTAAALAGAVEHLLMQFGPRRLMWGSDWPVCELVCSYETWVASSDELLGALSEEERVAVLSENARMTYGI